MKISITYSTFKFKSEQKNTQIKSNLCFKIFQITNCETLKHMFTSL